MKRTYTVNFDNFNKKGEFVEFTQKYTLFVKYADKFFDTLRGLMPDFNIYVVRSKEV